MSSEKESSFRSEHSLTERTEESARIVAKYSDRVPVIVEPDLKKGTTIPYIDKKKYLVPNDLSLGQFIFVIRKRLKLPANEAIYIFTSTGIIPTTSQQMIDIYRQHKDQDGFLYLTYSGENVFGN